MVHLGFAERSNMLLVGTSGGVFKVGCIKRLAALQSSEPELVTSIVGTPFDHTPGGTRAGPRTTHSDRTHCFRGRVASSQRNPETIPRRFYVRRDVDLKLYGCTDGCLGCNEAFGKATQYGVLRPD